MLYTVIPLSKIYRVRDEGAGNAVNKLTEIQDGTRILQLKDDKTIERMISTDPADYLLEDFCPGKNYV